MNDTFPKGQIIEPTLLLNRQVCLANIHRMAEKANRHRLAFRPHFKTHQSHSIGRWFRQAGVEKITVSSLRMAEYFAKDGWNDITVAFPANLLEIERIKRLASTIQLNLLVESLETIDFLEKNVGTSVNIYLKIDVGYHRTGISPERDDKINVFLNRLDACIHLNFSGFLAHAGHSYSARTQQEIAEIHASSITILRELKARYRSKFPEMIISTGDTPTCSVMDDFEGVDEIRPGNFVFYDLTQNAIGSCELKDIAVALACPIVAKHDDRNELILYGGGVHFSKDRLVISDGERTIHGVPVHLNDNGWEFIANNENYVSRLSQEHGTLKIEKQVFEQYEVGDVIGILPVHSCMTANLMKRYRTFEGELIDRL